MQLIEKANQQAIERMVTGDPVLVDVIPAADAIPELEIVCHNFPGFVVPVY